MRYTALGHRSEYFELYDDKNTPLGVLNYDVWFSADGKVVLASGDTYQLGPSNFWMTNMEMRKGDIIIAAAKRSWAMNVVITIGYSEYHFKGVGLLNRHYALISEHDEELVVLRPDFQWKDLKFSYEIDASDNYKEFADPAILLFLIYCCNYITRHSGVAGTF